MMAADTSASCIIVTFPMRMLCVSRGGLILYRTTVNATWLKAGATLYVGAHVADHAHVSLPVSVSWPILACRC